MKSRVFVDYFDKYKDFIMRIAMKETGDYHASQDICQQVFMSLYTNMDKVDKKHAKAWLSRCARNAAVDHLRRVKAKKEYFVDTTLEEAGNLLVEECIEKHEEQLQRRILTDKILRAVREKNEGWYEALELICIEGLSYEEAAKRLNVSVAVLTARMYRIRSFIKKRFGDEYSDY